MNPMFFKEVIVFVIRETRELSSSDKVRIFFNFIDTTAFKSVIFIFQTMKENVLRQLLSRKDIQFRRNQGISNSH